MAIMDKESLYDYGQERLQKIKDLELMILEEFIRICEENDIEYYLDGGSAIGAIRHKGFIPWDDDIDVIMLRKDYDKFLKVMESYKSDKFELLSSLNKEYYCRIFSELKLKGTKTERYYSSEFTDFDTGISMDIFALDNIPDGFMENKLFKIKYWIYRKLLFAYEVTYNDKYISKNKQRVGRVINSIFKFFNINNIFMKKMGDSLVAKYKNKDCKNVANLSTTYELGSFPKNMFSPPKKVKFEHLTVNVPKEYDEYLRSIYGDYMELPPVEKRVNHSWKEVDFGDY